MRLKDNGTNYRVTKYIASAPDREGMDPIWMVMANGAFEDSSIWQGLAVRLADIAIRNEQQMTIVTYDDSSQGRGAKDILSYRADRLASVINTTKDDGTKIINGHSRGWISSVLAMDQVGDDIQGLIGYGAAGLAPVNQGSVSLLGTYGQAMGEVLSEISTHWTSTNVLGNMALGTSFFWNAAIRATFDSAGLYAESSQILTTDVLPKTAQLSKSMPVTLWVHRRDEFFDATTVTSNLLSAGYQGQARQVNTSHLGPLVQTGLAEPLYSDIISLQSASLPV